MGFLSDAASSVKNIVSGSSESSSKEVKFSGLCPGCKFQISYSKDDESAYCKRCRTHHKVTDLLKINSTSSHAEARSNIDIAAIAMSIDTPDSGLVYMESFFESYDWDYYKTTSVVGIEEIDGMVEKNKIKNGANPKAWVLDFKSKAIPLIKKIEGLKDLEAKMAEKYNTVDNSEALEDFDVYTRIIKNIFDCGENVGKDKTYASPSEAVLKKLNTDIEYAKKFGASVDECSEMESLYANLTALIRTLKLPEKLDEVSSIAKKKAEISKEKEKELASQGIDAQSTYRSAVEIYDSTVADKSRALALFESIRGYLDSVDYIQKINLLFNYKNKFFTVCGKYFIFEEEKEVFDPNEDKKAKKEREKQQKLEAQDDDGVAITTYAIYEIVKGQPAKDPAVKGITKILGNYGNKLYYIQKKKNICCYDVIKQIETVIDEGKKGYYESTDGKQNLFFADEGKGFFMRKLISIEKVGCFKSILNSIKSFFKNLFKKNKKPFVRKNNYTIVYVDMVNATKKYLVNELLDITKFDSKTNTLFYVVADNDPESEAIYFNECNVLTGEARQILDDSCEVHDIVDNKIIYSVWTPNDFNKNLYAMDLETDEKTLIETNIYDYFCAIKGRVYYTVGNAAYEPLFSNNLEGTDRLEIMQNVERVIGERGGWIYFTQSSGRGLKYDYNRALLKISSDGKQTIVVCGQLKDIILFTDSNVFYIDCFDNLCVVRSDGQDYRVIAPDIEKKNVVVADDGIFYLRDEMVDDDNYESSLYKMDLTGHNTRKLLFNVYDIEDCDKDTLYVTREEDLMFEITYPVSLKKTEKVEEEHHVTRYYKFDKKTEEATVILATGLPDITTDEFKKGCLRKKIKTQSSYRELPRKGFKYNTADAGSAYKAQIAQEKAIKANKKKRK